MLLSICQCRGSSPLADLARARSLTSDLRVQFAQVDKATTQAVMADTDEASEAFVTEARTAAASVVGDLDALKPLLQTLRYVREREILEKFADRWTKYRMIEGQVLALAAEKTNLKAQRLAFGPAREAADAFRDAVALLAKAAPRDETCTAERLSLTAAISVREIQVILAPHVAESDDAVMTRMEQEMAVLEQKARTAVGGLAALCGTGAARSAASALASLDHFKQVCQQITELSRRNTNVRSLALSLHDQATLAASCDEDLRALQLGLDQEGVGPSR